MINTTRMMGRKNRRVDQFDSEACAWVDKLGEATYFRSGIVISSKWRHTHGLDQLSGILHVNKITIPVVGRTPTIGGVMNRSRGEEIQRFLDQTRIPVESYVVIVDVDYDVSPPIPINRLVRTNHFTGFDAKDYEKAVEILNK